jgi:Mn2+/Fe2+ NRAMP family transporter
MELYTVNISRGIKNEKNGSQCLVNANLAMSADMLGLPIDTVIFFLTTIANLLLLFKYRKNGVKLDSYAKIFMLVFEICFLISML